MQDIFDVGDVGIERGEFFSFKKVGDNVQGTYIDKHEATDTYGNQQMVYTLIDRKNNDKMWSIGIRTTNTILNDRMAEANIGCIVGFRFDKEVKSKKYPDKMAKVINAYFDKEIVDHAWLAERARKIDGMGTALRGQGAAPVVSEAEQAWRDLGAPANTAGYVRTPAPEDVVPMVASIPVTSHVETHETLDAIRKLAVDKGVASAGLPVDILDALIEAVTGFKLSNQDEYTKIIIKLSGYTK